MDLNWHRVNGLLNCHPNCLNMVISDPGYGYIRSCADYSLFTYRKGDVFMALLVYIDDLVLTRNCCITCVEFKKCLNNCFHIKDLGPL